MIESRKRKAQTLYNKGWKIWLLLIFLTPLYGCAQQPPEFLENVELLKRTTLTTTAYCSDGSDRARNGQPRFHGPMVARINSYKGFQYVSYYEANGNIILERNEIGSDTWEKLIIPNYRMTSQDRHNKIALGISKADGVIHLSFDHHNSVTFNYAKSVSGLATDPEKFDWSSNLFTLQSNLGLEDNFGLITYPSFYDIESTGGLLMYWRTGGAIGGEMNLARYDPLLKSWTFIGQISSRDGSYNGQKGTRGPYHAGFVSDNYGKIHVGWLWREAEAQRKKNVNIGNHGISYAQSADGGKTWVSENGDIVADLEKGLVMTIDNPSGIAIEVPMELDPTNAGFTSIYDQYGHHLIFLISHLNDQKEELFNYLYVRDNKGQWTKYETGLKSGGQMIAVKNRLLLFNAGGVFYSKISDGFKNWVKLEHPFELKKGSVDWDLSRIEEGRVNFVIQYNPEKIGQPTPVELFELQLN